MRVIFIYIKRVQLLQIQLMTAGIILLKLYIMEYNYIFNLKSVLVNVVGIIKILFIYNSQPSCTRDSFLYICVSSVELLYIKYQQLCSGLDCFSRQCLLSGYAEFNGKDMLISVYNFCWRHSRRLFNSRSICL